MALMLSPPNSLYELEFGAKSQRPMFSVTRQASVSLSDNFGCTEQPGAEYRDLLRPKRQI